MFWVRTIFLVCDIQQCAVVAECPTVKRACECRSPAPFFPAQPRTAMCACIDKTFQFARPVPGQKNGLTTDCQGQKGAFVDELAFMGEKHPATLKDVLHLEVEQFRIGEYGAVEHEAPARRVLDKTRIQTVTNAIE